jgi:DNA-binding transcriptional MocR family regulator
VAAYDLLEADGLIERRRGSGTFVLGADALGLPAGREGSALVHRLVDRGAAPDDLIDLSISVLSDATGLPDVGVTSADLVGTGYDPWGLPALRGSIADHVTG